MRDGILLEAVVDHDLFDVAKNLGRNDNLVVDAVADRFHLVEVILTNHHIILLRRLELIHSLVERRFNSRVVRHTSQQMFLFRLHSHIRLV